MSTPLIRTDGKPFESPYLAACRRDLNTLDTAGRQQFRNTNAEAIATLDSSQVLVVSGPGTGKSTLFLRRIHHWMEGDGEAKILVTSFVRKLVHDLAADIERDDRLTAAQKQQVRVLTLHKLARSVVETNGGTHAWPFRRFIRIVVDPWDEILWQDVLAFHPPPEHKTRRAFAQYLHGDARDTGSIWKGLEASYYRLFQYFNAAGFADLIIRARVAVEENAGLVPERHVIVDEYQDFNLAEEAFIQQLTKDATGVLMAGDDDQVLYERLKAGDPALVRALYENPGLANGMLPFCSRCSFHVTSAASQFIEQHPEAGRIDKIYLPLKVEPESERVQVIACARPATVMAYVAQWTDAHRSEILKRQEDLGTGAAKDPFLLLLTPSRRMKFLGTDAANLRKLVASFQKPDSTQPSEDYRMVAEFYGLARHVEDNWSVRKALHHRGVSVARVHDLLEVGLRDGLLLKDIAAPEIADVLEAARQIHETLQRNDTAATLAQRCAAALTLEDEVAFAEELGRRPFSDKSMDRLRQQQEEIAEQQEVEGHVARAVELMTIVGSKGLSADHVIILGCDDVSMKHISPKAFYVGMTRARKSLQMIVNVGASGASGPHQFVRELPDAHSSRSKFTKSDAELKPFATTTAFLRYFGALAYQSQRARTS